MKKKESLDNIMNLDESRHFDRVMNIKKFSWKNITK